ncbi:hypothetical protein [Cylindrospermum stagnale]|uniref:hypothetical protein n=1 Tax=Cylindrospermum stagnale TaxID=142864 RepID=UPI001FE113DC|nr:hypothetical protein [Cylindrospermum stagnale]
MKPAQDQTPDAQAKAERSKEVGKSFIDGAIFAYRPIPPKPPRLQMKLTVGQPGDKYEQEADKMAANVVQQINAPESESVQRQTPENDKDRTIGRAGLQLSQSTQAAQLTSRQGEPYIQCKLSPEEKKGFGTVILQLKAEFKSFTENKDISKPVKDGLIRDFDTIKIAYEAENTTSESFSDLLNQFSEKLDQVKQYSEALDEAKKIFAAGVDNKQAEIELEKRIDNFEFNLKYEELSDIVQERGANTLNSLLELARRHRKEDLPTAKVKGKAVQEPLTKEEEQQEKAKESAGSYVGFKTLETVPYRVNVYGEDYTYSDPEKTVQKDIVRMYEIKWKPNPKTNKQHGPWVLHIHFTLKDKLTVAHFKRYKNHAAGAGTNLTNYDGDIARMFYNAAKNPTW